MSASSEALIQLDGVTKVFLTDEVETHALSGIHLEIKNGEYVSIAGPSGCGKTTLLSILGLLDTPSDGKYWLNGKQVADLSFSDRARIRNKEIGFIFQAFNLIGDLTVYENVELPLTHRGMPAKERKDRVQEALERVGMSHRMKHYPSQLSGGQQQRVAVARAVVGKPSILLADEPTGNLDSKNSETVMDLLADLHRDGATICMVTHDPRFARYAKRTVLGRSKIFTPEVINDIHMKAELGRYRMRGFSMFKKIPHWDELVFLPGTLTRFVIEGYREKCETKTVLGARFAQKPIELDIPVYITGMSFGALSLEAKMALAKGASMAGTATCSGEGGMIPPERDLSTKWYYQVIQSRYGFNPHHLMLADAVEFFIGQGCKVGLGGHLMGQKVTEQVAEMRSLPAGIDQRSPARHPDWLGPDDLSLKIQEIREATDYQIPIQLKLGAARVYDDVRMAAKCGPDIIYLDGAEGSTGAGPHLATEETGIPLMAAIPEARRALEDVGLADEIDLVVAGGIRNGGDIAKCLALGAKVVAIGHSALMALNCNKEIPGVTDYEGTVGVPAGRCYHCHTGRCPVGITTQDPELRKRLVVDDAAQRVYNFLHTLTLEVQMLARACGKTDVHSLEPEDLCALTVEAAAMARVPLAGTDYIPGVTENRALERIERLLERRLDTPVVEEMPSGNGSEVL